NASCATMLPDQRRGVLNMKALKMCASALFAMTLTASGYSQCQLQKIVASDGECHDNFGGSVAVNGDWCVIGARSESDIAVNSGAAYVFQRVGTTWTEMQKLKASDAAMNIFAEF